jgi:hypothetical protein
MFERFLAENISFEFGKILMIESISYFDSMEWEDARHLW